jgi:hypothetical protein
MDLIGVNYYYSQVASARRFIIRPKGEQSSNYTQNGWLIDPEGLHAVLMTVSKRYGKPMVISENGIGTQSEQKKIRYFREHVNQMRRAMEDSWADVLVNRRWQHLAGLLNAADCERLLQRASQRDLVVGGSRWVSSDSATEGWALEASGGFAAAHPTTGASRTGRPVASTAAAPARQLTI